MKIFIYKNIRYIFTLLLIIGCLPIQAQEEELSTILPGPKGAIVLLLGAYVEDIDKPINPEDQILIYRKSSQEKFKKIGETKFPKSATEMRSKLGELMEHLHDEFHTKTDVQLYTTLTSLPVDSLGVLFMNYEVSKALGFVFFDDSFKFGQPYEYRIERVSNSKKSISEFMAQTDGLLPVYSGHLQLDKTHITDSIAVASWTMAVDMVPLESVFVNVKIYRQSGDGFEYYGQTKFSHTESGEEFVVSLADDLVPGNTYGYYMQITDWAGNTGSPSDTLFVLAYNKHNLLSITELKAYPQEEAILLNWEKLPDETVYAGIEIQKSRNYDSAYVVLDTIAASEVSFLDSRVLKGSIYYYRLRPLYALEVNEEIVYAETAATIVYSEENLKPNIPQGLAATAIDEGVRLTWWGADELDVFGYFVLRGLSKNQMDVVSSVVKDITYIDTLQLDGFSGQYLYAIQAINHNQQLSDTSDLVVVNIRQPSYVTAPAGLAARKVVEGIALTWNNVKEVDDNVVAYVVFRKVADEADEYKIIHENAVSVPYFIDSVYAENTTLEYAVSSLDIWGNFSNLSPIATVDVREDYELLPPLELSLRNLGSGIEVSWPTSLTEKKGVYIIYRKEEGKSDYLKIGEADIRKVFIDRNVTKNMAYEYRVQHAFENKESVPSLSKELRR